MDEDRFRGLHRWLFGHFGTDESVLYAALTAFLAIAVSGLAAYLFRQPLTLLISGPIAVLFFKAPMARSSSPRNAITGHLVGLTIGFVAHAAFGVPDAPSALQGRDLPRPPSVLRRYRLP